MQDRTAVVLNSIIRQYIARAVPVSSASVVDDCDLDVSSATIRNEMACLEEEGYIIRPHHAAGSVPSDKGYRYYVGTLSDVELPAAEKRLIDHLFHQVEENLEEWLGLAVTLLAQRVHNIAVVTLPRPPACEFKHLELVSLQDHLALAVLVLRGAVLRQQLVSFDQPISQDELTAVASRLNDTYSGLSALQIAVKKIELSAIEQRTTDCLLKMMHNEDDRGQQQPYMDGLHFLMTQPEFSTGRRMMGLIGLLEQRKLVSAMLPSQPDSFGVQVVIGKENREELIQDYSVVASRYGLPDEAVGTIGVVGPTRMPYARTISAIGYMASMMSRLVAELYGVKLTDDGQQPGDN